MVSVLRVLEWTRIRSQLTDVAAAFHNGGQDSSGDVAFSATRSEGLIWRADGASPPVRRPSPSRIASSARWAPSSETILKQIGDKIVDLVRLDPAGTVVETVFLVQFIVLI